MIRKNRIIAAVTLAAIAAGILTAPSTSMFTGFDENPASSAETSVEFDGNPAADATTAVPQQRHDRPRVHQQSTVSANASTRGSGDVDATQNTSTLIDDRLDYRPQQEFDNVFVQQEARSDIRQDCRVDGSCAQRAQADINQYADVDIQGRFTNVFLTQDAASEFEQNCRADGTCDQETDSAINQQSDFGGHWSSNGFVTRNQEETWTRTAADRQ